MSQPLFPKKESTACGPRPPPCFVVWLHIYFQVKFSFRWTGPYNKKFTIIYKKTTGICMNNIIWTYRKYMTVKQKNISCPSISCLISAISAVNQNNEPNYETLAPLRSVPSVPNVWHLLPGEEITGGCHVQQVLCVCFCLQKRINRRHWIL